MLRLFAIGIGTALLSSGASSLFPTPASADDAKPMNCIIYMEYEGALGVGSKTIASNSDIVGSAVALAKKLPGDASSTQMVKLDHTLTIDEALQRFSEPANGKRTKCCKRIDIVGHGSSLGELELPHKHSADHPEQMGVDKIGGSHADDPDANPKLPRSKEQIALKEFIASLKAAACPDPVVHFQACYSAIPGSSGIAKEVANFGGMTTTGYTGQCDFPHEEPLPNKPLVFHAPQAADGSKEVTTKPSPPKKEEKHK